MSTTELEVSVREICNLNKINIALTELTQHANVHSVGFWPIDTSSTRWSVRVRNSYGWGADIHEAYHNAVAKDRREHDEQAIRLRHERAAAAEIAALRRETQAASAENQPSERNT